MRLPDSVVDDWLKYEIEELENQIIFGITSPDFSGMTAEINELIRQRAELAEILRNPSTF